MRCFQLIHVLPTMQEFMFALVGVDRSTDTVLAFRKVFYTCVTYVKGGTFRPINAHI